MGMKWHYSTQTDCYSLVDGSAQIIPRGTMIDWVVRVKNRNGGYNYAIAASLAAAKRKAAKMMREEAT